MLPIWKTYPPSPNKRDDKHNVKSLIWGIVLLVGGAIIFGVSLYVLANLPNAPEHIFRN